MTIGKITEGGNSRCGRGRSGESEWMSLEKRNAVRALLAFIDFKRLSIKRLLQLWGAGALL